VVLANSAMNSTWVCCVVFFQVTLNNVEVCSENIMTLKKTLEVRSRFFVFSVTKFVIPSLGVSNKPSRLRTLLCPDS